MDPIYQIYTESISTEKILEMSKVPMSDMPKDKANWEAEVKKLVATLNNRFGSPLSFTINKVDWDSGSQKGVEYKSAWFTIDIGIDVSKSKYIDSVPYVNLTKVFYKELQDVVKTVIGVDKISYNNTGSTFWGNLTSTETNA